MQLSELVAMVEASKLGPPNLIEAENGCAPAVWWTSNERQLVRVTFYGRRAMVGVVGLLDEIPVPDLSGLCNALDKVYEYLIANGYLAKACKVQKEKT